MEDLRVGLPDDEDPGDETEETETDDNQLGVGFGPLGGIQVTIGDRTVTLDPERAFVVAGLIQTHAVMLVQMSYAQQAQQAMEEARIRDQILGGGRGVGGINLGR